MKDLLQIWIYYAPKKNVKNVDMFKNEDWKK